MESLQWPDHLSYEVLCVEGCSLQEQIDNRKTSRIAASRQHGFLRTDSLLDDYK
jgi:hypothetical protein